MHRFAVLTAICTFLLIVAGGLVTSTQSGLSVPDWPTTYGHFMFAFPLDQMVGGIFFEHSHRMIASFVGFLTILLTIWLWKREQRRWVRNLGFVALGSVVAQGLLGGLTVLLLLPAAVSVAHAALAQSFFVIVSSIAVFTSDSWRLTNDAALGPERNSPPVTLLAGLTFGTVFIQLLFGALMRHTDAGLAVPDFPLAYGQIFPSLSQESIAQYNQQLVQSGIRLGGDEPITSGQIVVHMAHRAWAVVVIMMVLWTAFRLTKLRSIDKRFGQFAYLLLGLIVVQATLGAFTVLSRKAVDITTAHVATGALLLVSSALLTLHSVKLFGLRSRRPAPAIVPREVTA